VVLENHSGGATRPRKKFDIFFRFDTIPACDRQTRDHSNSGAMQSVARITRKYTNIISTAGQARRALHLLALISLELNYLRPTEQYLNENVTRKSHTSCWTVDSLKSSFRFFLAFRNTCCIDFHAHTVFRLRAHKSHVKPVPLLGARKENELRRRRSCQSDNPLSIYVSQVQACRFTTALQFAVESSYN